jgi:hypothetical protein
LLKAQSIVSRRSVLRAAGGALVASGAPGLASTGTPTPEPPADPIQSPARSDAGFVHPGLLHSQADLDRMRTAVQAQQAPIYAGFQAMAAHYGAVIASTMQKPRWFLTSDFVPMHVNEHVANLRFLDSATAPAADLLAITSADADLAAGAPAVYTISATGFPTGFAADGLPAGLPSTRRQPYDGRPPRCLPCRMT